MPRYKRASERVEQLIAMLRAGNYLEVAREAAGITPDELAHLFGFEHNAARIAQARAEGEARTVTLIAQAARDNWQAAAWLLERQHPERWSRPLARDTDLQAPDLGADGVDDLAAKRAARRARLRP